MLKLHGHTVVVEGASEGGQKKFIGVGGKNICHPTTKFLATPLHKKLLLPHTQTFLNLTPKKVLPSHIPKNVWHRTIQKILPPHRKKLCHVTSQKFFATPTTKKFCLHTQKDFCHLTPQKCFPPLPPHCCLLHYNSSLCLSSSFSIYT